MAAAGTGYPAWGIGNGGSVISTIDSLEPVDDRRLRRRRVAYSVTTCFLAAVMALGVLDALGWVDAYGVDTGRVEASGGGYELVVRRSSCSCSSRWATSCNKASRRRTTR